MNEALRDWAATVTNTHYIIGSVVGPHPFPQLVRDLQRVIGDEARAQYAERIGRRPRRTCVACVGGGSNAIGMFTAFVGAPGVRADRGRGRRPRDAARRALLVDHAGTARASCTARSRYLLQDADGQVVETHSISAGLDYPGVGPEHAYLQDDGLARYVSATDDDALDGVPGARAAREGIIPALEPAHVIGWLLQRPLPEGARVLVCLSGRGDKDLDTVLRGARRGPRLMGDLEVALRARRDGGGRRPSSPT